MKMRKVFLAALMSLGATAGANAASFDCAKASSRIDNAICASTNLSKLDDELDVVYKIVLANNSDPGAVRAAQRVWLKETRNACQDEACMVTVYQQRIAALSGTVAVEETEAQNDPLSPGPSSSISIVATPTVKASDVASPAVNQPFPATSTSATQTSAAPTVATPMQTNIQSTQARVKETHDRLTGVIVLSLIFGSILAFLVARKHAKWKIALSAIVLLIVIASYFAPQPEPEKTYSVAELDAKLTGKWTTYDSVAPACPKNGAFFIRQADGTMEITGDDGQVINKSTWKMERVYDNNLGAIRIEHPGRAPIYWVVQFLGQDMKTSIILNSPPAKKSEALEDLAKSDPNYPDIKLPMMHKCGGDTAAAAETVHSAQGKLKEQFIQKSMEDSPRIFRRQPMVGELLRAALTLGYYSDDKRCKDMWNDTLHVAVEQIALLDKQAAAEGSNDALAVQIAVTKQAVLRQSGCMPQQ